LFVGAAPDVDGFNNRLFAIQVGDHNVGIEHDHNPTRLSEARRMRRWYARPCTGFVFQSPRISFHIFDDTRPRLESAILILV